MSIQKGKFVHSLDISLRWIDMDAFGHVNNSMFLTYFEQIRIDWLYHVMPNHTALDITGPVIVNAYCTFLQPIVYPETLSVKLLVGPPGRSSYESYYEINSLSKPEIKYGEGSTKVVWVDRQLGKSTPIPEWIRQHLPEE